MKLLFFKKKRMIWDELIDAFQQSLKSVLIAEKSASHLLLTLFCQVEKKNWSIFSCGSRLIDVNFHSEICMFNYSFPLISVFVTFTIH